MCIFANVNEKISLHISHKPVELQQKYTAHTSSGRWCSESEGSGCFQKQDEESQYHRKRANPGLDE